ncbi:MAG: ATP-dependent RecD-like DNA helicase [Selenomonadales bacterium]|jgi:helicase, recD/traA family|nr:ATP-dependent RecD-like DNA helicase [Clostridiales bacterium]PWM00780.1 MAG: ATP-dependent RecD-like DNA helicase [Selenomonadales bacterium]
MQEKTLRLSGIVEDIIFRNDANGYTVFELNCGATLETVMGSFPVLSEGEHITVEGCWQQHKNYGMQFKASSYSIERPETLEDIEAYLASGLIKGVGPSTARAIVDVFGEASLDVLEFNPERLREIPGLGKSRAEKIAQSYAGVSGMRQSIMFLQKLGVSTAMAVKIHKHYGAETLERIKANPYQLVDDIDGVGFKSADKIARQLGLEHDSAFRTASGIRHILSEAGGEGNMFLPREELVERCAGLLEIEKAAVEDALESGILERRLITREVKGVAAVYLAPYYYAEVKVSASLMLLKNSAESVSGNIDEDIKICEEETGIELAQGQREAVKAALSRGVAVITGGPGTGKTTAINCIIRIFTLKGKRVELAAPTGRAAKRMTEATGREARTIHRLLEYSPDDEGFKFARNAEAPLECDACIIDETSMVDIFLMKSLLDALKPGSCLVLVGDADQLPSIGAGNVLRDIIASGAVPVVRLSEIFRQAMESMIVVNAHRINRGEPPLLNVKGKDFFFESCADEYEAARNVVALCQSRLPSHFKAEPLKDIQVLCPQKRGECGVNRLNVLLQNALNPPAPFKNERAAGEYVFREGDKVMHIRNNYQLAFKRFNENGAVIKGEGVFNGDMGSIERIEPRGDVTVRFEDGRECEYDQAALNDLMLAYAISVHKSQGCEFRVVVMPLWQGNPMLYTRNLLYTAVTRAREAVVLTGSKSMLGYMVNNNQLSERYSALDERMAAAERVLCDES